MIFGITHRTEYRYPEPAAESVAEMRIHPRSCAHQRVRERHLRTDPEVETGRFEDYFGNLAEYFSVPFPHEQLLVESYAVVETRPAEDFRCFGEWTVAEARQVLKADRLAAYDFMLPTPQVPLGAVLRPLRKRFGRVEEGFLDMLLGLNEWIHLRFTYRQGVTDVSTPLAEVIRRREGVCQDFAHLMLSILRTAGIPSRYVSGYIEAWDPSQPRRKRLVGAAASHAWVEVFLPGGRWIGLDPTNNQIAGERHVRVAVGRDYQDVAPLRGTYKGGRSQELKVTVRMERLAGADV